MTYQVRRMGNEADPRWAGVINGFWGEKVEVGPPLQGTYFKSRTDISTWAYSQYLDAFAIGGMPHLVAVIPERFQGVALFGTWEAKTWYQYQVAVISQSNWPSLKFSLLHEFGHLLSLPDHFWPFTCIMTWLPWWLLPLPLRNVCYRCRKLLKEV